MLETTVARASGSGFQSYGRSHAQAANAADNNRHTNRLFLTIRRFTALEEPARLQPANAKTGDPIPGRPCD